MYTKPRYSTKDFIKWTRWEILGFTIYTSIIAVAHQILGLEFLYLPWTPMALIGTAVAFIVGFQNNAAYGRIWEARKIWGGIVNSSRTWGMKVQDMVTSELAEEEVSEEELTEHRRILIYRHIAWLTALRHAMRQPKKWEAMGEHVTNQEWMKIIHVQEKIVRLEDELIHYLEGEDWHEIENKNNKAAAILFLQSKHLRELKEKKLLWQFSFLDLEKLLEEFFTLQGKSERIKNFPYPRQYSSLSHVFVWVFLILLPFGLVPEFEKMGQSLVANFPHIGEAFVWVSIPFVVLVSWIFHTMQRIATVGENPFEGSPNDVPISTIARGIEIDLRQMLNEDPDEIPGQFPEEYDVQM